MKLALDVSDMNNDVLCHSKRSELSSKRNKTYSHPQAAVPGNYATYALIPKTMQLSPARSTARIVGGHEFIEKFFRLQRTGRKSS